MKIPKQTYNGTDWERTDKDCITLTHTEYDCHGPLDSTIYLTSHDLREMLKELKKA